MARILVIEDDEDTREMLVTLLKIEDYEVAAASNGKEGFKLFCEPPADLVITDLFMPEQDGIETIRPLEIDELLRTVRELLEQVK